MRVNFCNQFIAPIADLPAFGGIPDIPSIYKKSVSALSQSIQKKLNVRVPYFLSNSARTFFFFFKHGSIWTNDT
jgi:hypothetical protein